MAWFAVRSVVKNEDAFEERITVWEAPSADEAIALAEREASVYAWEGTEALPFFQAFRMDGEPRSGSEVFSLIRRSPLSASEYVDAFFDTGNEVQDSQHDG
jgi:hypothetical protein